MTDGGRSIDRRMIDPAFASAAEDIAAAGRIMEWGWLYIVVPLATAVLFLVGIVRKNDVKDIREMKDDIKKLHDRQEDLRLSANSIEGQVSRIASDMESEKRPRADTNAMIIRQLENLNHELMKRNKGRSGDAC